MRGFGATATPPNRPKRRRWARRAIFDVVGIICSIGNSERHGRVFRHIGVRITSWCFIRIQKQAWHPCSTSKHPFCQYLCSLIIMVLRTDRPEILVGTHLYNFASTSLVSFQSRFFFVECFNFVLKFTKLVVADFSRYFLGALWQSWLISNKVFC